MASSIIITMLLPKKMLEVRTDDDDYNNVFLGRLCVCALQV